jgi:ribosomal protein S18
MYTNLCRTISYLLLTAGLQVYFFDWLDYSDYATFHIAIVLAFFLLILACWQHNKIAKYKKRAWMAENPADFRPELIDCYVSFTGKIAAERVHRLPFSSSECAFYMAAAVAEWETKKKKPGKGMETQRKPLLREQSSDELELVDKDYRVYVKAEDFSKNWIELRKREKTQQLCPALVVAQVDAKYKRYQIVERFLQKGDKVIAQGRLALNNDGRLFIKPTKRLEFPSFVAVQPQANQFICDITDKANSDAWTKRINAAFSLLNALLLVYFWW